METSWFVANIINASRLSNYQEENETISFLAVGLNRKICLIVTEKRSCQIKPALKLSANTINASRQENVERRRMNLHANIFVQMQVMFSWKSKQTKNLRELSQTGFCYHDNYHLIIFHIKKVFIFEDFYFPSKDLNKKP